MNIICPNCKTKFIIDETLIDRAFGKTMKCSKCMNVWHYKHQEEYDLCVLNTVKTDLHTNDKGINLPVVIPKPSTIIVEKKSNIMVFIMMSLIMIMAIIPSNLRLFSLFNRNDIQIYVTKVTSSGENIQVEYDLINNSANDLDVPRVKIVLFDKNNKPLKTYIDNNGGMIIIGKSKVHLSKRLVNVPNYTDKLELMVGNILDFAIF